MESRRNSGSVECSVDCDANSSTAASSTRKKTNISSLRDGRMCAPRMSAPRMRAPRMCAPRLRAPRMRAPRMRVPRMCVPGMSAAVVLLLISSQLTEPAEGFRLTDEESFRTAEYSEDFPAASELPLADSPACPSKNPAIGQKCPKACETTDDCRGRRKRCLCDGACGLACVNPNSRCGNPLPPPNGRLDYLPSERRFGDVVIFACVDGFASRGAKAKRCGSDGEWWPSDAYGNPFAGGGDDENGGGEPRCVSEEEADDSRPQYCGHPGPVANAKMTGDNFEYPAMVQIVCEDGFLTTAPPGISSTPKSLSKLGKLRCRKDGKWAGIKPVCVSLAAATTTATATTTTTDKPGKPGGGGGGGKKKKKKRCGKIAKVRHGSVIPSGGARRANAIGAKVTFQCDYSYQLVGPSEMVCGEDEKWIGIGEGEEGDGEMPKCVKTDCGSPGELPNGRIEGDQTTLDSIVVFQCDQGATFEGIADRAKCLANGKWSNPVPKCWQSCVVPNVANGLVLEYLPGSHVSHGQMLNIQCVDGHFLTPPSSDDILDVAMCACADGSIANLPTCEPAPCAERPPWIRKGKVIFDSQRHGSKAKFECDSGYALRFDEDDDDPSPPASLEIVCRHGLWEGRVPICLPKLCPYPGSLADGQIFLVGNLGEYDYRPYIPNVGEKRKIRFACDEEFKLEGPTAATCVDGEWSPEERPVCQPEKHPVLHQDLRGKRSVPSVFPISGGGGDGGGESSSTSSCLLPRHVDIGVDNDGATNLTVWQPWTLNSVDGQPAARLSFSASSSSPVDPSSATSLPHGSLISLTCTAPTHSSSSSFSSSSSSSPSSSSSSPLSPSSLRLVNDLDGAETEKGTENDEELKDAAKTSQCFNGIWTPAISNCADNQ